MKVDTLIIGSGLGGVAISQALSGKRRVVLIDGEEFLPYYRMRLEEVVSGKSPESIYQHNSSWYEDKRIELIKGRVVRLDPSKKEVELEDGEIIGADNIVIATGAKANTLFLKGDGRQYCLRSMEDALDLREKLKSGVRSAVILGAGLLGIELGRVISESYSIPVLLIENQPYILQKQLDEKSAKFLEHYLEEKNLFFKCGKSVVSLTKDGVLTLNDGQEVEAPICISSVGVTPDISFLKGSGITTNRGIIVNEYLETNFENIYAIGDVAELNGRGFSLALFAREQGLHAASEILEGKKKYTPSSFSSVLKITDLDCQIFGTKDGEEVVLEESDKTRVTLFVKDRVLVGAILMNNKAFASKVRSTLNKEFKMEDFKID